VAGANMPMARYSITANFNVSSTEAAPAAAARSPKK
jgi:hypothetical protein